jgi:hypothetical protein
MFGRVSNSLRFSAGRTRNVILDWFDLFMIYELLRNSPNIRNPLIYSVNRYFLMFGRVSNSLRFSAGRTRNVILDPYIMV